MDLLSASRSDFQRSALAVARLPDRSRLLLWWSPDTPLSPSSLVQVFYSKWRHVDPDPVPEMELRITPRRKGGPPPWTGRVYTVAATVSDACPRPGLRRACQGVLMLKVI